MPLIDKITVELGAQEPWPKDVKLFQPYDVEQILLPDNANCLAVQAFLKMCHLDFQVELRANAEAMSPTLKVPFIKAGRFVTAELEGIVQFVNGKGISLTDKLDNEQKADMRAYMSLIHSVIEVAELYVCWIDSETYNEVTSIRNGSIYPWPLNHFQNLIKKSQVIKKLKALDWYNKTLEEVFQEVENCCEALSIRLDGKSYFFDDSHPACFTVSDIPTGRHLYLSWTSFIWDIPKGMADPEEGGRTRKIKASLTYRVSEIRGLLLWSQKCPTELDALVFGHLFTILTTPLPRSDLANIVRNYPQLINLVQRIEKKYFKKETKH